ncbi:hypothetical protein CVT25_007090 [Psilocybe cyanescens]|uniref:Uncharacterized protein n=1 Tax=Psilocybe cyanescens TaxID=93625 RepID=A0A409XRQ9_PSICY|nr:hypothetical protein CVT25_007090 [Psilocybe cyanescens]
MLLTLADLCSRDKVSKRAIRKYYHSNAYPTSDVDLLLWGMTPDQAQSRSRRYTTLFEILCPGMPLAFALNIPFLFIVRNYFVVYLVITPYHSSARYPHQSVQIVLRVYQSPAEILSGIDIDALCCAYYGKRSSYSIVCAFIYRKSDNRVWRTLAP